MRRVVGSLLLAAAYGAGSQYLGARVPGWGPDVSALSAPWLLIAFLAGWTQRTPLRAALLGIGCTLAALAGYLLLTDSPLEGALYSVANTRAFLISNAFTIAGGLVTGPLFGWLGHRWRTRRALLGALVCAAALCLEPLMRRAPLGELHFSGRAYVLTNPIGSQPVVLVEIAAGVIFAAYAVMARLPPRGIRR
jgi:hypothetical protein